MTTKELLEIIAERYPLSPKDAGEFKTLTVNGMTFEISPYYAAGLGHVSLMHGAASFAPMAVDTLIVAPYEKELPLLSYDRISAMGTDTLFVEFYDTLTAPCDMSSVETARDSGRALPDHDPGAHWYDSIRLKESLFKKAGADQTPALDELAKAVFRAYALIPAPAPASLAEKRRKTADYVSALLSHGGPSTDPFIKQLGEAKTRDLYTKVLFGTEE
jgi:hypothetical protein